MISINNPVQATLIFISIFVLALLISVRRQKEGGILSISLTQELKGFAILAIVFSHTGYFLVSDHSFLFPLTILAGVGVNLFLFLSGFGLTNSALNKDLSIWDFYKKRLLKLFVPFWIVIFIFVLLDYFLLNINYSSEFLIKAILGIFTTADIYNDLNSPLWYFTIILFYYIIFPIVFFKKRPWLSALILFIIPFLILRQEPEILKNVINLYKVHTLAFPLGVLAAWFFSKERLPKIKNNLLTSKIFRYFLIIILLVVINYLAFNAGIGEKYYVEQFISIITSLAIILVFSLKKFEFGLFSLFGIYSYEIYLLHWPIMSRYDFLYKFMPAWLATALYLILFLSLGFLLSKIGKWRKSSLPEKL
jgi:peptidoglycan/LPS O-acetylase OafA/YrhL